MSAARTAKPSTVARAKPGRSCGARIGSAGTRPCAPARATVSIRGAPRRPEAGERLGHGPDREELALGGRTVPRGRRLRLGVFAVLRVLARLGAAAVHAEHAEHRAERDLAEPADRRHPQRLLELRDLLRHVVDALALLERGR